MQTRNVTAFQAEKTGRIKMQPRQTRTSRLPVVNASSALSQCNSFIARSYFHEEQTINALVPERKQSGTIKRQHFSRFDETANVGSIREQYCGGSQASISK